jgi:hypothetical protein
MRFDLLTKKWCCTPANGAWEDGLVHVAHVAAHCVCTCCCTLVVFIWASTCYTGVVVVQVAAMREAIVPVLAWFYRQGGEAAWGLLSSVATALSAAVAPTTTNVATAVHVAATAPAVLAATVNVVAATAAAAATVAAVVVATALLAMAASTLWASWLLLWGLAGADCLAEHLKLLLYRQDVGSV